MSSLYQSVGWVWTTPVCSCFSTCSFWVRSKGFGKTPNQANLLVLEEKFFAFRELIVLNLHLIFNRGFSQKRCQNLTEPYRTKLQLQPILQCLGVAMLCWHSATWSRSVRQCWTCCSRIVVLNWFLQECFVNLRFDDNWCRPSWLHLSTTWHIATMPVPLFSYTALAFRLPRLNN